VRREPPRSGALSAAVYRIEQILGPRGRAEELAAVHAILRDALDSQARFIAHLARTEALAFQRGEHPHSAQQLTYDGGLRRGARIAESQRGQS
jgi:hypothetical protein